MRLPSDARQGRVEATWRLEPSLPRSVGLGPMHAPPFGAKGCAVERAGAPLDGVRTAATVEQSPVQPHAGADRLLFAQPPLFG